MHRTRANTGSQGRERRLRLAHEAARLMAESGIQDFHQAKRKAAQRLGIHDELSLPRNVEIEAALREHQRLFAGPGHAATLQRQRRAALHALEFLQAFSPRLVGPVLDGTADSHSPVQLQVHDDDPDAVQRFFEEHGIPADARARRLRMDRGRTRDVLVWQFSAEDLVFEVTVLPYDALRQAPLSAVDDKPMRRASAAQVRQLLDSPAPPPTL